jgi:DegV family protein with EDD domain
MIRIVTDSSSDIPQHIAAALDIAVVPLIINFGNESFREGVDITHDEFYERLIRESPNLPKTAIPTPNDFEQVYRDILSEDDDIQIISLHPSSQLTGVYNLAHMVAQDVAPDRITVVDSRNVSMCLGWTAIAAAEAALRDESLEDVLALIDDMLPRLRIPSFLDTLEFIKAGGRIGGAEALLGSVLDVKPILHLEEGAVAPLEKVRTRGKAMDRLVELAEELAPFDDLAVMHTHSPHLAEELAKKLSSVHPRGNILIAETGCAMGTHTGPNSIGICAVVTNP